MRGEGIHLGTVGLLLRKRSGAMHFVTGDGLMPLSA